MGRNGNCTVHARPYMFEVKLLEFVTNCVEGEMSGEVVSTVAVFRGKFVVAMFGGIIVVVVADTIGQITPAAFSWSHS